MKTFAGTAATLYVRMKFASSSWQVFPQVGSECVGTDMPVIVPPHIQMDPATWWPLTAVYGPGPPSSTTVVSPGTATQLGTMSSALPAMWSGPNGTQSASARPLQRSAYIAVCV